MKWVCFLFLFLRQRKCYKGVQHLTFLVLQLTQEEISSHFSCLSGQRTDKISESKRVFTKRWHSSIFCQFLPVAKTSQNRRLPSSTLLRALPTSKAPNHFCRPQWWRKLPQQPKYPLFFILNHPFSRTQNRQWFVSKPKTTPVPIHLQKVFGTYFKGRKKK